MSENRANDLTSTTPYLSGRTRARATIFLLAACVVTGLLGIISSYLQIDLLSDALAGGEITDERAEANDLREVLVAVLTFLVYIATVVSFSMWIHRAYRNLRALGHSPSSLEYSPGWAVGWFFVPFANLFYPFRVVNEIWRKSDAHAEDVDAAFMSSAATATPPLILWWWVLWLASNFADNIAFRFSDKAETPGQMLTFTWFALIVNFLDIASAGLAILVVREIERRQEERSKRVTLLDNAPPPPPLFEATGEPLTGSGPAQSPGG
jgi:hypothetical protein